MESFEDWLEKEFLSEMERTLEIEEMSYRESIERQESKTHRGRHVNYTSLVLASQ